MKIGIVLNTKEPETVWNALRFGVTALLGGHEVKAFLLGHAVEIEKIYDAKFDVSAQVQKFLSAGGKMMACGTCLKIRQMGSMELCPVSSMHDLLEMVEESDRVLTFS